MYLVFDTETTGLPKNWKAPMQEVDNWPRVIQLAWTLYGEDRQVISAGKDLIKPDGWHIPVEKFWIENGFSQFENIKRGIPMTQALDRFIEALERSRYLIAHNMSFDHNVLGAEMLRYQRSTAYKVEKICTKDTSTNICKIRNNWGGYKWPKLEELHVYLFKSNFEGAHDAGFDVAACAKCFFELVDRKHIILKEAPVS